MDITTYGDGGWKVVVVTAILFVMQLLMLCGRIVSRTLRKSRLAKDDFMLIAATTLTISLCPIAVAFPRIAGVAYHVGSERNDDLTEGRLAKQVFLAWTILYGLSIATAKWAILLLYLRVFTHKSRWFSMGFYSMACLVSLTAISNTLVAIFECEPVNYLWKSNLTQGSCIDVVAFNRYMAIPNVISGIIMLVLPLPLVLRLNIGTLQKIALSATFLHGIIGVIASIARLAVLSQPVSATNSNSTSLTQTIWTLNEPANYIIAACLPTLRPIALLIFPESFFVLSKRRSSSHSKPYTSNLKISWPRGSPLPRIRVERERFVREGGMRMGMGMGGMGGVSPSPMSPVGGSGRAGSGGKEGGLGLGVGSKNAGEGAGREEKAGKSAGGGELTQIIAEEKSWYRDATVTEKECGSGSTTRSGSGCGGVTTPREIEEV